MFGKEIFKTKLKQSDIEPGTAEFDVTAEIFYKKYRESYNPSINANLATNSIKVNYLDYVCNFDFYSDPNCSPESFVIKI